MTGKCEDLRSLAAPTERRGGDSGPLPRRRRDSGDGRRACVALPCRRPSREGRWRATNTATRGPHWRARASRRESDRRRRRDRPSRLRASPPRLDRGARCDRMRPRSGDRGRVGGPPRRGATPPTARRPADRRPPAATAPTDRRPPAAPDRRPSPVARARPRRAARRPTDRTVDRRDPAGPTDPAARAPTATAALSPGVDTSCLSLPRGNGKSRLAAHVLARGHGPQRWAVPARHRECSVRGLNRTGTDSAPLRPRRS